MRQSTAQFRQLLISERPKDAEEQLFVRRWVERRHEEMCDTLYKFGLIFNAFGLLATPFVPYAEVRRERVIYHLFLSSLSVVWLLAMRKRSHLNRALSFSTQLLYVFLFALMMPTRMRLDVGAFDTASVPSIFAAMSVFLLIACPYAGWAVPVTAGAFLLAGAWAVHGYPDAHTWLVILGLGLGAGTFFNWVLANNRQTSALREFRARLKIAPRSIVRAFLGTTAELAASFTPSLRESMCLCIEWHPTDDGAGPEVRLGRLNQFYAACDEALRAVISSGNYYTDWLGGELFIVLFADDPSESARFADEAVEVAWRLTEKVAPGDRVDVAIARGTAHIGMMGPATCRKATAIGEVCGRARRLLGVVPWLRGPDQAHSWVVFGEDTRSLLVQAWPYEEVGLDGTGRRLRDVEDALLFCLAGRSGLDVQETG